jgi:hypothetical protein
MNKRTTFALVLALLSLLLISGAVAAMGLRR